MFKLYHPNQINIGRFDRNKCHRANCQRYKYQREKCQRFMRRQITGTFLSKEIDRVMVARGMYAIKTFAIHIYQKDNCPGRVTEGQIKKAKEHMTNGRGTNDKWQKDKWKMAEGQLAERQIARVISVKRLIWRQMTGTFKGRRLPEGFMQKDIWQKDSMPEEHMTEGGLLKVMASEASSMDNRQSDSCYMPGW